VDSRGYLVRAQLATLLRKVYPAMPDAKVDTYFKEADRRSVGQINVDDFVAFATKYENKIPLFRNALF
jgi:Ca2+-binding EF-hand superfamily protein